MNLKILYKVKVRNDVDRTRNCIKIMESMIPHRVGKLERQQIRLATSNGLLLHRVLTYLWRDMTCPYLVTNYITMRFYYIL